MQTIEFYKICSTIYNTGSSNIEAGVYPPTLVYWLNLIVSLVIMLNAAKLKFWYKFDLIKAKDPFFL